MKFFFNISCIVYVLGVMGSSESKGKITTGPITVSGGGQVHFANRSNSVNDVITDANRQLNALDGAYTYMYMHTEFWSAFKSTVLVFSHDRDVEC